MALPTPLQAFSGVPKINTAPDKQTIVDGEKMTGAQALIRSLEDLGVEDVFGIPGGAILPVYHEIKDNTKFRFVLMRHEQAAGHAAEGYALATGKVGVCIVTSGPGATNVVTAIADANMDSVPMVVITGQVGVQAIGTDAFQEADIVGITYPVSKHSFLVTRAQDIPRVLSEAYYIANTGRPGPVWIDIPVNYQGGYIETDSLPGYDPAQDDARLPPPVDDATVQMVLEKIRHAKRPVFHAGYGIRLSGGYAVFRAVAEKLNIPIVTYWNAVDLIEDENPLYCGRAGNMGDRPGNWAIQNADLILAVGTRISIRQVGYNWKTWARAAEVIMVDIDRAEMKKHTLHVEHPVWADAKDFLQKLDAAAAPLTPVSQAADWLATCQRWKKDYPAVLPRQWEENGTTANVYAFVRYLSSRLPENSLTAVSNGACCVVGNQAYVIQKGSRMANNSAIASMGYGLPAAIGTCIAGGPPYHHLPGRRWLYHDEPAGIADHPDK